MRWRFLRASLLAAFGSLEAGINVQKPDFERIGRFSRTDKWRRSGYIDFSSSVDQASWSDFNLLRLTRDSLLHYKGEEEHNERLYGKLESNIDRFIEATTVLLSRAFSAVAVKDWGANLTPHDAILESC